MSSYTRNEITSKQPVSVSIRLSPDIATTLEGLGTTHLLPLRIWMEKS